MAAKQTIQLKRHQTGNALVIGTAPLTFGSGGIAPGEMVSDEVANILYIGVGADANGYSTNIVAIGGTGAFVKIGLVGAVNGVASLDANGHIPAAQLPVLAIDGGTI